MNEARKRIRKRTREDSVEGAAPYVQRVDGGEGEDAHDAGEKASPQIAVNHGTRVSQTTNPSVVNRHQPINTNPSTNAHNDTMNRQPSKLEDNGTHLTR